MSNDKTLITHDENKVKANKPFNGEVEWRKQIENSLYAQLRLAEFVAHINSIIVQDNTLNIMLDNCADTLINHLNVAFARIWTFNENNNMLELQASAGMDTPATRIDSLHSRVSIDKCIVEFIAKNREPYVTNSVIDNPMVSDQEWAKQERIAGLAGHPLVLGKQLVGVIAVFDQKPIAGTCIQMMKSVANEIALGINRKQAAMKIEHLASFPKLNINPILELDSSGTIIFYNKAAAKALNKPGQTVDYNRFLPKDIKILLANLKRPEDVQVYREVELNGFIFAENIHFVQKFKVVRIYTRDITKRRRIEVDLKKHQKHIQELLKERLASEERFKSIVNTVPDIVYKIDPNGHFVFINHAVQTLGYESKDIMGKHFSEIILPADLDSVSRSKILEKYAGEKTGDKGAPKLFDERRSGKRMTTGLEVRLIKKTKEDKQDEIANDKIINKNDRSVIIAEVNSSGVHQININTSQVEYTGTYGVIKDKDMKFNGTTGVIRDITERKQIEEKLHKLTIAIDQSPSIVMITDTKGDIEYVNPKFTKLTGYTFEEVTGKNSRILKSGKQTNDIYRSLWEAITSGREWQGELLNKNKGGELYWESASFSAIKDAKNVITNFVKVSEDITRRKMAEDELMIHHHQLEKLIDKRTAKLNETYEQLVHAEKLNAIGQLSASIAHEFNNPIFGILNVLERITEDVPMDAGHKNFVNMAIRECGRISDLIKKLQDFYRPSTGIPVLTDIHNIIEDVLMLIEKELKVKKIKLEKNYDAKTPIIKAVSDQIKQVILNIINNAEQAIPKEGGQISISTENLETKVRISIYDSGTGINAKDIKHIFEPFFTTKSVKGTGLGLSVSYGIIKNHGGEITAKSQPGKGTTFSIILPVNRDN